MSFAFRIVRSMGVTGRCCVHYRSPDARDAGAQRLADRDGRPVFAQFFTDDHWFTVAAFYPTGGDTAAQMRETVWCEAHGGLDNPHFERDDCLYPHFTDQQIRARLNSAIPTEAGKAT